MTTARRKAFSPPAKKNAEYHNIASTPVNSRPSSQAAKKGGARGTGEPRGTYIYNPANPAASFSTTDVSVQQQTPYSNPTVASGQVTAPTNQQLICDTGPLPAGPYYVVISMKADGVAAVGKHIVGEHRNAANSGNQAFKGACPYPGTMQFEFKRIVLALNERIRVEQGVVPGAAGEIVVANIEAYLLPV